MQRVSFLIIVLVIGLSVIAAVAGPIDDGKSVVAAMKRGDWDTAVQLWTRAIDSSRLDRSSLVSAHGNRATSYLKINKFIEALSDYSRTIELGIRFGYPAKYLAYNYSNRASLYIKLKRYRLAISDGDTAIRLNPQDHIGYYNRGRANELLGQRSAAIRDFHAVLRKNPNHKLSQTALKRLGVP